MGSGKQIDICLCHPRRANRRTRFPRKSRTLTKTMHNTQSTQLLFELSKPGAAPCGCRRATCRKDRWPICCRPGPWRNAAAAAGTLRAGRGPALRQPLDPEHVGRRQLLSAGLVYDEVQPQAERAAGGPAGHGRPAPLSARIDPARHAGPVAPGPAHAGRDRRAAGRLAPAGRRGARRNDRPAGGRRLFPRSEAEAHGRADSRRRPRHQSGQRRHGRLPGRAGQEHGRAASSTSTIWPPSSTTRRPCS